MRPPDHREKAQAGRGFAMSLALLLLLCGCATGLPDARLRVMVPTVPGGGYDVTARTAATISQRSDLGTSITVFNLDGERGVLALRRLLAERGNDNLTMMMGLGVIGASVTTPGADRVTAATPIARLVLENEAVLVSARSPYRSIGALVAAWRADPAGMPVGGGSAIGGPDHLMWMRLAEAVGIDPAKVRYLSFDGGGGLLPALLSGRVGVAASSVVEFATQIDSGQLSVLAVSGPNRLPGIAAPTLTEAGVDVVFVNWRGVLAPPGIPAAERDRLVELWRRLTQTPEWSAAVQRAGLTNTFLPGDEFGAFLDAQDAQVRATLARLGLP